jgi:uncharacterized repeat protein (TIGR03803 family)
MKRIVDAFEKLSWGKRACAFALCAATAIAIPAQTLTALHNFDGADGSYPFGPLVKSNGNFYGTTYYGGNSSNGGTVFKMTPTGALKTLYDFCSQAGCTDGETPSALIKGTDGNFYGTTSGGGANGYGTFFRITPSGALTVVYNFTINDVYPSQVIQATNGDFYGTNANGAGRVFEITPTGTLTNLYSFCTLSGCADGRAPVAGVIQGKDGNFYGTTEEGGTTNTDCPSGCGTVFQMTPSGTLTTLHSFDYTDGAQIEAPLVQARNGNFYGTAFGGGTGTWGTVFEVTSGGTFTTLFNFPVLAGAPGGEFPSGALIQGSNGNFFGITSDGGEGSEDGGTVFEVTPGGELASLYGFCSQGNCSDGAVPVGALVQYTNGEFIGATTKGGTSSNCSGGCGTIFELLPGNPNIVANCNLANSQSGLPPYSGTCGITNQGQEFVDVKVVSVTVSGVPCDYKHEPIQGLVPGQSVSFPIKYSGACGDETYTLTIDGTYAGGTFSGSNTFGPCVVAAATGRATRQ